MKKILAFSGSNSPKSINQRLVHIATKNVKGAEVEIINLRDYTAPVFGVEEQAENGIPESIQSLHSKMQEVDGFLISSPEHNGSMPAVFKNTIDWLSILEMKVFMNKPTVFLATSPGPRGGASVLKHLLDIMPYRGANIIGGHALGSFNDKVVDEELTDKDDNTKIQGLIDQLVTAL
jgi:NAD(P)H-dependent FMN reductase